MEEKEERIKRLKRLKRKRMLTVLVLFVLLSVLGGGYFIARRYIEKKASEEAEREAGKNVTAEMDVTTFLLKDVASIEYTNEEASYGFTWVKNEGEYIGRWVRMGMEDFPTKDEKVQSIISGFCGLTSTTKIPAGEVELSDYGLDTPKCSAKLTLTDGTIHQFYVGNEAPYSSGYYMLEESTGDVWVVSNGIYTRLSTPELKLVQEETFPDTETENITEVTVAVRGEDKVSYIPQTNEDGTVNYPAIFYDCKKFIASTVQEYNCTDFAEYGLDDPYVTVTVHYMENVKDAEGNVTQEMRTMTAEIGNRTVSDNYFVRINGSPYVYIMTAANAKKYIPE